MGRPVDHDLGDRRVGQETFERPEAGDLVEHLVDQAQALVAGDGEALAADDPVDEALDPAADLGGGGIDHGSEGAGHLRLEEEA